MLNKKIAFIGPGVMAEAMIAGLLRQKLASPKNMIASGPREERGGELHKKYGIKVTTDNVSAVHDADVVVLSVKPQQTQRSNEGPQRHPSGRVGTFHYRGRYHKEDQHGLET